MARLCHPAQSQSYRKSKSPTRHQRVTRARNAKRPQGFISPSKHKKGPVQDKESVVRTQLQKQLANQPIAIPLSDSDDSDRLVTKRKYAAKVQRPIYASGGVAKGDTPGAHPSRKRKSLDEGEVSPEKRRQMGQGSGSGSGLKRPMKSSLRSPLAPILPNATLSSSPPNATPAQTAATAPVTSSAMRPNANTIILPAVETSIIGTLKPRRRQPSILQIIETNDSSRLTGDDGNDFLPDDESTPLPLSRTTAAIATPGSSLRRPNKDALSLSGLRRVTPVNKKKAPPGIPGAIDDPILSSSPVPPELSRDNITKQLPSRAMEEDSVMAPPASSSPTASPPKSRPKIMNTASSKFKKPAVSTEFLQSLGPRQSRRSQRERQKAPRGEFDIPEDLGSQGQLDGPSDNSETSPFKPAKRIGRGKPTISRNRRGTSVLSNITTNSKVSKNVQRAGGARKEKGGGGARHFSTTSGASRGGEKENTPLRNGVSFEGDRDDGDDELQRIRNKFAEIDDWDMEFEDVEVEGGSSQEGYR